MSNRFRNLKLGRTFTSSNRLTPLSLETSTSVQDLTFKTSTSPQIQVSDGCEMSSIKETIPLNYHLNINLINLYIVSQFLHFFYYYGINKRHCRAI